jgi:hypothetical protein
MAIVKVNKCKINNYQIIAMELVPCKYRVWEKVYIFAALHGSCFIFFEMGLKGKPV